MNTCPLFEPAHITKEGHRITCGRCGYVWLSESQAKRICCSKCRTSITIKKTILSHPLRYRISIKDIEGLHIDRAIAWAKTNGQDYIEFKPDKNGVLSLA